MRSIIHPVSAFPWSDDPTDLPPAPAPFFVFQAGPATDILTVPATIQATDIFAAAAPPRANAATAPANPTGVTSAHAIAADLAASQYGVTGAGVRIGIISNSFNVTGTYAAQVASGALPAGITVLQEGPAGSTDEGQAMAELVHSIAPGAQIDFTSGFNGEASFAQGIQALAAAGCNIIVDDVTYLDEPFYQDGSAVQAAVESVVAQGVSYFTSASNEGQNFLEAAFKPSSTKLPGLSGSYQTENFGTAAAPSPYASLTVAKGATVTIDLQWDQPYAGIGGSSGAANSLGEILYDATGRIVAYAVQNDVGGDPDQILRFTNTTASTAFRLAIVTNGGATVPDQFKFIVYGNGTTINDPNAGSGSGTVIGHEMVPSANVVGAISYANTPAYGGSLAVESFSSVGPGSFLFNAAGQRLATPTTPDAVDFVAPDGTATPTFGNFYGTSAAAPVAAATAALVLQANPGLSPAAVSSILAATATALPGGAAATGAGLIDAAAAVAAAQAALPQPTHRASNASQLKAQFPALGNTPFITHDFLPGIRGLPSANAFVSVDAPFAASPAAQASSFAMVSGSDPVMIPLPG